jgi:hypothetical protein
MGTDSKYDKRTERSREEAATRQGETDADEAFVRGDSEAVGRGQDDAKAARMRYRGPTQHGRITRYSAGDRLGRDPQSPPEEVRSDFDRYVDRNDAMRKRLGYSKGGKVRGKKC